MRDILSYLLEHRDARDTLRGITEWWLLERHVQRGVAQVQEALADLVGRDLIIEKRTADGRVHYCINRGKETEIAKLFEARSHEDNGTVT